MSELKALVLGLGNRLRGDDGAGDEVMNLLEERRIEGVEVRRLGGEAVDLMEAWEGKAKVIVVDAVRSGAPAGTLHRFQVDRDPVPLQLFGKSTHTFSVAEAIELARALGKLPSCLTLYGLEGTSFGIGEPVSPSVQSALPHLLEQIINDIQGG